ncbi:MAG: hypothetical protein K2H92_09935 [Bacteroidaceae bacterium]|nr:hypothetical protein [Bacteroidaceae bacterium]
MRTIVLPLQDYNPSTAGQQSFRRRTTVLVKQDRNEDYAVWNGFSTVGLAS